MAAAQSDEYTKAVRQGDALQKAGRYGEAIPFSLKALQMGEREFGADHSTTATLLHNLAVLYLGQGRYADAEPLFRRSLAIDEKALGRDHPSTDGSLNNLAVLYLRQGRYADAEPLFKRSLAIREKVLGPDHPEIAKSFNELAGLYLGQARYADAERLFKRSLAIWEKTFGSDHPDVATSINNIALLYKKQGRYADAEPLYKRSLAIREKTFGPDHPEVATSVINLAGLYLSQARYADAEPLFKRSLAIDEKALGRDHPSTAVSLNNLATLYLRQARYADAEPLYKRSQAIREKSLGPDHPDVALSLNNLATLYQEQGRYADAEPLYKRSLAIREKALGPGHPEIALSLNNLATLYEEQGRYANAEPLLKRSLAIWKKALGPNHPNVALSLNSLAGLYLLQARYADVEPLYKHSLAIREKALGPDHPDVAISLNSLAELYQIQGRYVDAEPLLKRSLAVAEKALGSDHPNVAQSLISLAALYKDQARYADAESLFKRSLAIWEKALGPDHPKIALSLNALAGLYLGQARYADAEALLKRSLAVAEKAFEPGHPLVALSLNSLAVLYQIQGRYGVALDHIRRASAIYRQRAVRSSGQRSGGGLSEQMNARNVYINHISGAQFVAGGEPQRQAVLIAEAFEAGQLATATSTAAALAGMGARFAAGDDALSNLVRARQDALEAWRHLDNKLIKVASQPPNKSNKKSEQQLRAQLRELDIKLKTLDERVNAEFPEYAELASSQPVPLSDLQKLLGPDEALLFYVVAELNTFLWVVRNDDARMFKLDIRQDGLSNAVKALRAGLDPIGIFSLSDLPQFDTAKAFQLYGKIFASAEPMLGGIQHLFVVPDGPLQSLPLGVLVTKETQGGFTDFSGYRQVPWLVRKYALTTLPSASSLRALRRFAKVTQASKPFGGIGDPLLRGHPGENRGVKLASLFTSRGIADVNAVRTRLAPLPETADELEAMARILGADKADLFLRERATESRIKAEALNKYRVLAFATHGLVVGELEGLAEPALVLTPPKIGSKQDDGLLTASEVATLKLNADMVVLSACNTAAPDGSPEAKALSGLAKAFFYAGSRSLLVSHWPVSSDAAVKLTTTMLKESTNSTIGRAEGLRRSMLALMENKEKPHYAHPMFWAPFVVVGEGGIYSTK